MMELSQSHDLKIICSEFKHSSVNLHISRRGSCGCWEFAELCIESFLLGEKYILQNVCHVCKILVCYTWWRNSFFGLGVPGLCLPLKCGNEPCLFRWLEWTMRIWEIQQCFFVGGGLHAKLRECQIFFWTENKYESKTFDLGRISPCHMESHCGSSLHSNSTALYYTDLCLIGLLHQMHSLLYKHCAKLQKLESTPDAVKYIVACPPSPPLPTSRNGRVSSKESGLSSFLR